MSDAYQKLLNKARARVPVEHVSDEDLASMVNKSLVEAYGGKSPRTFEIIYSALVELQERRAEDEET